MKEKEKIEKEIGKINKSIEAREKRGREVDASMYSERAALYKSLFAREENQEYKEQAIENYGLAIEADESSGYKNASIYVIERSKLYAEIGQVERALDDIKLLDELPASGNIREFYVNNTKQKIMQMNDIQNAINRLSDKGEISSDLAGILTGQANVLTGVLIDNQRQDDTLLQHDDLIAQLMERMEALEQENKITREECVVLKEKLEQVSVEVKEIDIRIIDIEEQINGINHVLDKSGIQFDVAFIDKLEELKVTNIELYNYSKSFVGTMYTYVRAFSMIDNNLIEALDDNVDPKIKAAKGIASKLVKFIPTIGDVCSSLIDSIYGVYEKYQKQQYEKQVEVNLDQLTALLPKYQDNVISNIVMHILMSETEHGISKRGEIESYHREDKTKGYAKKIMNIVKMLPIGEDGGVFEIFQDGLKYVKGGLEGANVVAEKFGITGRTVEELAKKDVVNLLAQLYHNKEHFSGVEPDSEEFAVRAAELLCRGSLEDYISDQVLEQFKYLDNDYVQLNEEELSGYKEAYYLKTMRKFVDKSDDFAFREVNFNNFKEYFSRKKLTGIVEKVGVVTETEEDLLQKILGCKIVFAKGVFNRVNEKIEEKASSKNKDVLETRLLKFVNQFGEDQTSLISLIDGKIDSGDFDNYFVNELIKENALYQDNFEV